MQARVFGLIGLSPEEAQAKFGYLLDSFEVCLVMLLTRHCMKSAMQCVI